ncbi:MAG: hypothetical protein PHV82_00855 [Victivallaceae bacterium]|nr:hypothetical protein [Victivallaceae bacterium]
MSILNEIMNRYAMPDKIRNFLDSIEEKIARKQTEPQGCHSLKLDELYGILPETRAIRHTRETPDENLRAVISQWNLSEILILQNPWDDLNVTLWKQDGRYYCMKLKLFEKEWNVSVEPAVNHQEAEEVFPIVSRRLSLLASAFGNTPLRQLGIRQYIHEVIKCVGNESKRNFYLEFFLTLFHLELTAEELANQDIFLKRAILHCKSIIAMRSRCGVKTEAAKMAGMAAARGIEALLDELFIPINMIWGFLANRKALENLSIPASGRFCFREYYDTKGNIELGEIFSVSEREKSVFKIQHNRDCYTQVFLDYQTALTFRNIALKLLQSSNIRRKL